jgi:hypothetical protein
MPYCPRSQGKVERENATIKSMLTKLIDSNFLSLQVSEQGLLLSSGARKDSSQFTVPVPRRMVSSRERCLGWRTCRT